MPSLASRAGLVCSGQCDDVEEKNEREMGKRCW